MQRTDQRVAIVSGAGRGIGRAIALELAGAGFELCIAARTHEELAETRRLTGLDPRRSLIVLIDLAQDDAPSMLFEAALDHFGRVDALINNAGWAPARTALVKLSADDEARMIAVNLRAPAALSRLAAVRMKKQGSGVIINIASAAARMAPAGEAVYAATKAGLIAFTHACSNEMRGSGVRFSVIVPGLVDTGLIPSNRRLDRTAMLPPSAIAMAVRQIIDTPANICPIEIVLEPSADPLHAATRNAIR